MVKLNAEVECPVEMWYDGGGGGGIAVQLQQIMIVSGGKIRGKIKARGNSGGGDAWYNDSGREYCGFNEYGGGRYVVMKETAVKETWKIFRTTTEA